MQFLLITLIIYAISELSIYIFQLVIFMNTRSIKHRSMHELRTCAYQAFPPVNPDTMHLSPIPGLDTEWQMYFQYTCDHHLSPSYFHVQEFYEIIVIIHSNRKYLTETTLFDAGYGDVLLFAPGERHMGIHVKDALYERYYYYIHPLLLRQLPEGDRIASLFHSSSRVKNRISIPNDVFGELIPKEILQQGANAEPLTLLSLFYQLLSHLLQIRNKQSELSDTTHQQLSEILHYINSSYANIPSAAAIAEHFSISPSYMARLFRDSLAISPYQYLMHIRLDEARRMLEQGASVTEACYSCGFGDCSRFIQYFKREMGTTPSKMRKQK